MKKRIIQDQGLIWQVAEIGIVYRNKVPVSNLQTISSSQVVERVFREHWSNDIEVLEEFYCIFLNRENKPKGIFHASKGGLVGTVADQRVIFGIAVRIFATSIIVAHNHPSGNLKPSKQDLDLTQKLKQSGLILEIPIVDHLILAPQQGYYSFADEGMI